MLVQQSPAAIQDTREIAMLQLAGLGERPVRQHGAPVALVVGSHPGTGGRQ
jgi:hypothetical protein